jgi:hypothetical protein
VIEPGTALAQRAIGGHRGGTMAGAFSPDGRVLATGGRDRMLRLWDVLTAQERRSPLGLDHWITAVAFSPDGRLVASATTAGQIQLWAAHSGKPLGGRQGHRGPVPALVFADSKTLISGGQDTSILVWDLAKIEVEEVSRVVLTATERDELWKRMGQFDPTPAWVAMRRLARDAGGAVALVRGRVRPVDGKQTAKWIGELDSDEYKVRRQAFENLARVGRVAEPLLRKELAKKPSLEKHRRIEELLRNLAEDVLSAELLQGLRGVEVLEMIGTAEARKVLTTLAGGAADAELTRQAKAALGRLAKKK